LLVPFPRGRCDKKGPASLFFAAYVASSQKNMTIISFKYDFIFVKTQKTAGTSIEIELSKCLDDDEHAIITPIYPPVAGHMPRNCVSANLPGPFFNHMPALLIKHYLGEKVFHNMFSFCVEREPVAKCLSHFHMLRNSPEHNRDGKYQSTWSEYCDKGNFPVDLTQYSEFKNGAVHKIVNTILAYETLATSLPQIVDRLGMKDFKFEATAKAEYSKNRIVSYQDVTEAQRQIIYRAFERSLSLCGLYECSHRPNT
jgi:hypothetical protein